MTNALVDGLAATYAYALRHLERAVEDCPDDQWALPVWRDAPVHPLDGGGLGGSAPWLLAHHALTILSYDLTGGFEAWNPPAPFDEHIGGEANREFTRSEILGFVEWCRNRVTSTLEGLSDEQARRPLPAGHRYAGTAFGVILSTTPLHVLEHAEQIRQFLTTHRLAAG